MHPGTMLTDAARRWLIGPYAKNLYPTPSASDPSSMQNAHDRPSRGTPGLKTWATKGWRPPTAHAAEHSGDSTWGGLQDQAIKTDGAATSPPAVLNPAFVEALMGLPAGWTGFACAATE